MWLVVGANSQLGKCLIKELTSLNIKFHSATKQQLDITDAIAVEEILQQNKYSIVVNCAAWTAVDEAEDRVLDAMRVNCDGPQNLARSARRTNARLIHISTDYVFRGNATSPYEIDSPTDPINQYGKTKQSGESAVQMIGEGEFPIIRTAWLYSMYGKNFAKTMTARALKGLPVNVVDDQVGQPTLANDLANLIIEVATLRHGPEIVHGTNSGTATWYEFAKSIYELNKADPSLVSPVGTEYFPTKAERPKYSVLGHSDYATSGLTKLRHWHDALASEIDEIGKQVILEIK